MLSNLLRTRCTPYRSAQRALAAALLLLTAGIGCETSDATYAIVTNDYQAEAPPVVYKAWWSVALFRSPVPPGQSSDAVRVVRGTDYAYALLAPGWDATSGAPPAVLIPVRSAEPLSANRGDVLQISLSDATAVGNCAAGSTLSPEDASFITESIFPGEFATATYDPESCTTKPKAADGADSSP